MKLALLFIYSALAAYGVVALLKAMLDWAHKPRFIDVEPSEDVDISGLVVMGLEFVDGSQCELCLVTAYRSIAHEIHYFYARPHELIGFELGSHFSYLNQKLILDPKENPNDNPN